MATTKPALTLPLLTSSATRHADGDYYDVATVHNCCTADDETDVAHVRFAHLMKSAIVEVAAMAQVEKLDKKKLDYYVNDHDLVAFAHHSYDHGYDVVCEMIADVKYERAEVNCDDDEAVRYQRQEQTD
jgi:hypothetical protein